MNFVVTFVSAYKNTKKRKVSEDGHLTVSADSQFITLFSASGKYIKRFYNTLGTEIKVGGELSLDGYDVSVEAEFGQEFGKALTSTKLPSNSETVAPPDLASNFTPHSRPAFKKLHPSIYDSTDANAAISTKTSLCDETAFVSDSVDLPSEEIEGVSLKKPFIPGYVQLSNVTSAKERTCLQVPSQILRRLRPHQVQGVHFVLGAMQGHSGLQAMLGPELSPQCFAEKCEFSAESFACVVNSPQDNARHSNVSSDTESDDEAFQPYLRNDARCQSARPGDRQRRDQMARERLLQAHACREALPSAGADYRGSVVHRGAFLADDMGLGKTFTALAAAAACLAQKLPPAQAATMARKALIVCPAGLLEHWAREFKKLFGVSSVAPVLVRSGADRDMFMKFASNKVPYAIISYEMARKLGDAFSSEVQLLELLICDEGHRLKNSSGSDTLRALQALPAQRRLLLTGTPVQNDLDELHALVSFVSPGYLGPLSAFRSRYAAPILKARSRNATAEELHEAANAEAAVRGALQHIMLRRTQEHVLRSLLPPRRDVIIWMDLAPSQRAQYDAALRGVLSTACVQPVTGATSAHVLAYLQRLRRICNFADTDIEQPESDPESESEQEVDSVPKTMAVVMAEESDRTMKPAQRFEPFRPPHAAHAMGTKSAVLAPALPFDLLLAGSRKLQLLDAFLRQLREKSPQEKVVVVSNFTSMLALVQKLAAHRRWNALSLTGATAPRDRQALVERFNRADDPSFLFLLSSRAGGTGLSIIGGSRLVMLDPDWNPSTDHQALSRIWREGQTRPVFVYRLATVATVEQTIFSRQHGKGLLARLVSEPAESLGACFDDVESMRAIASPAIESVCTGKESPAADPADPVLQSLRLGVGGDPLFPKWIFRVDVDEAQTALHS